MCDISVTTDFVQDLVSRIDEELKAKLMDYNGLKSNLGQVRTVP